MGFIIIFFFNYKSSTSIVSLLGDSHLDFKVGSNPLFFIIIIVDSVLSFIVELARCGRPHSKIRFD